jgi:flagellar basal body-associated protein FliL
MIARVRRRGRSSGLVSLKVLVVLLVLAGVGYVGMKLIPPYWDYLSLQDPVKEAAIAYARHGKEAEVRAELIARARQIGIALDEERVDIGQEGNQVVVRVAWEIPLDIPLYRRSLRFRIEKGVPAP